MKRLTLSILAAAALGTALAGYAWHRYTQTPLDGFESPFILQVEAGSTAWIISRRLAEAGVIDEPRWFVWMARLRGDVGRIKTGEYRIEAGTTPARILDRLVAGEVIQYSLTLVEGWNFREVMQALRDHEALSHTLAKKTPARVMAALGHADEHPEGRFFPDTYHFPRGTEDRVILQRAYRKMETVLADEWQAREEGLPFDSAYQALILASIVEKETGVPEERGRIAGVFVRRLRKGMRLQTDPTVIYGLGETFDGNLTRAHLRGDNPYNTYRRAGLPPTPIAMPGRDAIHAVLHPADGDALYFVSRGDGSHVFSATLEEHNRAVRRYQLGDR